MKDGMNNFINNVKEKLIKINSYIEYDYGVNIINLWKKFINSKFFLIVKRISFGLFVIFMGGLCSFSIMVLWVTYPVLLAIIVILSILLLLYILLRDKLDEKYQIL